MVLLSLGHYWKILPMFRVLRPRTLMLIQTQWFSSVFYRWTYPHTSIFIWADDCLVGLCTYILLLILVDEFCLFLDVRGPPIYEVRMRRSRSLLFWLPLLNNSLIDTKAKYIRFGHGTVFNLVKKFYTREGLIFTRSVMPISRLVVQKDWSGYYTWTILLSLASDYPVELWGEALRLAIQTTDMMYILDVGGESKTAFEVLSSRSHISLGSASLELIVLLLFQLSSNVKHVLLWFWWQRLGSKRSPCRLFWWSSDLSWRCGWSVKLCSFLRDAMHPEMDLYLDIT
jgi:hypothetical protein